MKAHTLLSLGAVACAGLMTACGNTAAERADATTLSPTSVIAMHAALTPEQDLKTLFGEDGGAGDPNALPDTTNPNELTCRQIHKDLHAHREALAATDEWKALTETPEWTAIKEDVTAAHDASCEPKDPNPTAACEAIFTQLKQDLTALEGTSAYATAEATAQWQTLAEDYAAAAAHHCWDKWD